MARSHLVDKKRYQKVLILGANGMLGRFLYSNFLEHYKESNILTPSSKELDLTNGNLTHDYFRRHRPDLVILAAAKVGGILANINSPGDLILNNLSIQTNTISAAHLTGVQRLVFIASSCIYPKSIPGELSECDLLTGPLESTNEPFAIAKIAGIKTIQALRSQYNRDYFSLLGCNLYGPHDNFDIETGHVMASLIRKFTEARQQKKEEVEVWGSGQPRREFLYVQDMADACLFMAHQESITSPYVNIGHRHDHSIRELAEIIAKQLSYSGNIIFNPAYPDGVLRKKLNTSLLTSYGWMPTVSLEEGIKKTIHYYQTTFKKAL